jgi:hypothetical protein
MFKQISLRKRQAEKRPAITAASEDQKTEND